MGEVVTVSKCRICKNFFSLGSKKTCESCCVRLRISGRNSDMRKRGIEIVDYDIWYDKQLEVQNGMCAMPDCKLPAVKNRNGRLFIDHDHKTGKPRALLCHGCNLALGTHELRHKIFEAYLAKYKG